MTSHSFPLFQPCPSTITAAPSNQCTLTEVPHFLQRKSYTYLNCMEVHFQVIDNNPRQICHDAHIYRSDRWKNHPMIVKASGHISF
jgi:hypothetical protein